MTDRLQLLSPQEAGERMDPLASGLEAMPPGIVLGRLPYADLKGPGFERLCFELEVAEGKSPRYFGKVGQPDFEADIVVEVQEERIVLQCKNLSTPPSWQKIEQTVSKFEEEWLGEAGLPPPNRYIYCCPQPLEDIHLNTQWISFMDAFRKRSGVVVELRGKEYFDARLLRLPDLVASLFSEAMVEPFCGVDDWRETPWVRIARGKERHQPVQRFIERHDRGHIYLADDLQLHFEEAYSRASVLLIRGLPGSGKTLTGLELASRLTEPVRRIYYATLKDLGNVERLWRSARHRCHLPALFILDDCHQNFQVAEMLVERLHPELNDPCRPALILLIARNVPTADSDLKIPADLVEELKADKRVIDLPTSLAQTGAVVKHLRPDLIGLSPQRLNRLHHGTGGDLLLLEEALEDIASPADLDTFRPEKLYPRVRQRYFQNVSYLSTIRRIAGLAQFDLLPLCARFEGDWKLGEREFAASLMAEVFGPPRYSFLHPSMAELVFHALAELEIPRSSPDGWMRLAVEELVAYFQFLGTEVERGSYSAGTLFEDLEKIVRGPLKLSDANTQNIMKGKLLGHDAILDLLETRLGKLSFSMLSVCLHILSAGNPSSTKRYVEIISNQIRYFLNGHGDNAQQAVRTMGAGVQSLASNAPDELELVLEQFGVEDFKRLYANYTVLELFPILSKLPTAFAAKLLAELDTEFIDLVVDQTIKSGGPIRDLPYPVRELKATDEALLEQLELAIGQQRFLKFISVNGDIVDLIQILQYLTPSFAAGLLDELDATTVDQLIDKTIASGRSIGTLNFPMRNLEATDEALLRRLEGTIGPQRFLRLISANGSIFELFRILQYSTIMFTAELLDQLDPPTVEHLIAKTIALGRSIGTLNFTMRELGATDEALLQRLEGAIGPQHFMRLISANGSIPDLLGILQYSTRAFTKALLDQLDASTVDHLVDKTIVSGRSIGTLNFAMRDLKAKDEAFLPRLEEAIGPQRFLRLILANGSIFELFMLLKNATPPFAAVLLDQLDGPVVEQFVNKTIALGRSIGTLHLAMRDLEATDATLLRRLEEAIGPQRFMRLILANGSIFELFRILEYSKPIFAAALLGQLDTPTVEQLVDKTIVLGRSVGTLALAMRELEATDKVLLRRLEAAIGPQRFMRLISANGSIFELFRVLQYSNPSFASSLLCSLDVQTSVQLIDKAIRAGGSIEYSHYTLRHLARSKQQREDLQDRLTVEGWWRLIGFLGTLNSLSELSEAMTESFRTLFIQASTEVDIATWCRIILAGQYRNACTFVERDLTGYPTIARERFWEALSESASALVTSATWYDLRTSQLSITEITPEVEILRDAFQSRMEAAKPENLLGLGFREAVNAYGLLWRERGDLRPELAEQLWNILPPPKKWPLEDGEIAAIRIILTIARSEEVPEEDALRLLDVTLSILNKKICHETHTFPLLLLVWNLGALKYERTSTRSFKESLSPALLSTLATIIRERVRPKASNEEKLAQLALAGLVHFLDPTKATVLRQALRPLEGGLPWLKQQAWELTFVPALFALEGIALLQSRAKVFTPLVCYGLLKKAGEYEHLGPAIEYLRDRIQEERGSG